ncbi:MAG: phenylacetic acid degradation protein [Solirubrobacterales bacterium]|nr:phenylacetic acid degradation protein [Solirubrobacterales bacterium]
MPETVHEPAVPPGPLSADLLKMADEELFVGHVLTSVAGFGPELETNLAMSSMGQDEIGHARLLYGLVAGPDGAVINSLVYDREPPEFHAAPIASVYTEDWAVLLVKHLLYETADAERMRLVGACDAAGVAAIAGRVGHEEQFHLDYWHTWCERTMDVPEGPARVQAALDELWPSAHELFLFGGFAGAEVAAAKGRWSDEVTALCARYGLELRDGPVLADGRGRILEEMRSVYSAAPGAW